MKLRIIIADDHEVVRIGARSVIESSGIGLVVGEASDPMSLMNMLKTYPCDVLVTDYTMQGTMSEGNADGAAMLSRIHRLYPALPIVIVSMSRNAAIMKMVTAHGVLGLVDKASPLVELPLAIQAAHRRTLYISENLKTLALEQGTATGLKEGTRGLSPREAEVMRLLASGLTVKQIAEQQHKSISTISRQKGEAMLKLGLNGDAELYRYLKDADH